MTQNWMCSGNPEVTLSFSASTTYNILLFFRQNFLRSNVLSHVWALFRCKPSSDRLYIFNLKRIISTLIDRSTGSCICLRLDLYMPHVSLLCFYAYRLYVTCDMDKCSLRHIHDPELLSIKVEIIRFFCYFQTSCVSLVQCLTVSSPTYVSLGIVSCILLAISFRYWYRPFL